jgi:hypothetical protein
MNSEMVKKEKKKNTIDFFPVMVEGEDSGEDVVRERHGLRGGLQHHPDKFFDISNEETVRGASDPLLGEMVFNLSGSPPKQHDHLKQKH